MRRYHGRVPLATREPTLDDPTDPLNATGPRPADAVPPDPVEEAPGLFGQIGATRDSAKRLVGAHVELAKAEFEDIADSVKRAAAFIGVAIGAAIFAALLIGIGVPLWLGEWLFGSIGWGILLGVLLLAALAFVAIILALRPAVEGRIGRAFGGGLVVGVVVGLLFGLDVTNRLWTWLGDQVAGNLAADSRPLVVAILVLAGIGALVGLVMGLVRGLGAGAIGTLVAGALAGLALGFLTAAAPGPNVGAAIGVAAGLITWMALMGLSLGRGGFDTEKLKAAYLPNRTIEVTKETIEWARERMPLMRRS
jgi:hypothetical protein